MFPVSYCSHTDRESIHRLLCNILLAYRKGRRVTCLWLRPLHSIPFRCLSPTVLPNWMRKPFLFIWDATFLTARLKSNHICQELSRPLTGAPRDRTQAAMLASWYFLLFQVPPELLNLLHCDIYKHMVPSRLILGASENWQPGCDLWKRLRTSFVSCIRSRNLESFTSTETQRIYVPWKTISKR